jgi:hypothetical protein
MIDCMDPLDRQSISPLCVEWSCWFATHVLVLDASRRHDLCDPLSLLLYPLFTFIPLLSPLGTHPLLPCPFSTMVDGSPAEGSTQSSQYTSFSTLLKDRSRRRSSGNHSTAESPSGWRLPSADEGAHSRKDVKEKDEMMSTWKMMALTVSMGGSQVRRYARYTCVSRAD